MSYDLGDYAAMIADPVRGAAYLAAMRECVRPGSVVADIGAGPGVLGVYAAMLGARRVFLVEPDQSVGAALGLAAENGVADRIEIIARASTDIELPERADLIVSDLRGVLPLWQRHLVAAADMRRRLLAPGGACIPVRDTLHVAPVDDAALHDKVVRGWRPLAATMHVRTLGDLLANSWYRTHAAATQLLSPPAHWATLAYDDAPLTAVSGTCDVTVSRDGVLHGLLCWFDAALTATIGFSNAPAAPPALYGQAFFPLATPIAVRAGDTARLSLRAVQTAHDWEWAWAAEVTRSGTSVGAGRQATLKGQTASPGQLARRDARFVPRPSADAEAMALILECMDGSRSLAAIAAHLRERLPDRFGSERDALQFVASRDELFA